MGKGNRNKSKIKKGRNNSESDNQNLEGKCSHLHDCVKFTNLNNVIPHEDLSKCQECEKLIKEPSKHSSDKSLDTAEDGKIEAESTKAEKELDLCVCLRCGNIACSRQSRHQHAFQHYSSKSSHPLVVNLSNWVIWCYKCDEEIDVEIWSALGQCVAILKKALGVKNAKQTEKRTEQPQKRNSKLCSVTGKIAVKGLTNLGNTCFFNSVMQNLCQSQLLRVAMSLVANEFEYQVLPSVDKTELGQLSVTVTDKPGPLTSALAKFLQDMVSDGKKQVVNPGYLFTEICKKAQRFKGFRQQDSQELLRYLLDSVRTEEIKGVKRAILSSFGIKNSSNGGIPEDKVEEDVREKIRVYGRTAKAPVIDGLFGGQLVSSVECRVCHKVSTIMECFFDLSLSLATSNNTALVQSKTAPPVKKKKPPPPVANEKKAPTKTDKTIAQASPKPPPVLSKHQAKKKKKEIKKSKKKARKRHNSTSSSGKKKSETGDDEDTDEDENVENVVNKTSPDDVIENSVDHVIENSVDDVIPILDNDITETSVKKDLVDVKENVFMNLSKVGEGVKSDSVSKSSGECDILGTSQVIGASKDGEAVTSADGDINANACTNEKHDTACSNSNDKLPILLVEEMSILEDVNTKDILNNSENSTEVLKEDCSAMDGDRLGKNELNENGTSSNRDVQNPILTNELPSETPDCKKGNTCTRCCDDLENCNFDNAASVGNDIKGSCLGGKDDHTRNSSETSTRKTFNGFCDSSVENKPSGESQKSDFDGKNSTQSPNVHIAINDDESSNDKSSQNPESHARINQSDEADNVLQDKLSGESQDTGKDTPNGSNENCVTCTSNEDVASETEKILPDKFSNLSLSMNEYALVHNQTSVNKDTLVENDRLKVEEYVNKIVHSAMTQVLSRENPKSHTRNTTLESNESDPFLRNKLSGLSLNDTSYNESHENSAVKSETDASFSDKLSHSSQNKNVDTSIPSQTSPDNEHNDEKLKEYIVDGVVKQCTQSDVSRLSPTKTEGVSECQSSVMDTPLLKKIDPERIREFASKIVSDAIKHGLQRVSSGLLKSEENSMKDSVVLGEAEHEEVEGSVDSENLTGDSESEILSGNHSLGCMDDIKSNVMSVESCLKRFCSPELLEGDNKFICEQCNRIENEKVRENAEEETENEGGTDEEDNQKDGSAKKAPKREPIYTEAVKQLLIDQAPPILTLHLKRFHQVGFSLKKIGKHVDFPLVLNLAPFCHKSGKFATDAQGQVLYALSGVVEHSGNMHNGHYTAYCRVPTIPSSLFETKFENLTQFLELVDQMWTQGGNPESYVHEEPSSSRWFYISDSHVSEVSLERVLKAPAYLLFYERMVLSHGEK